jgi:hypothetical protein
MRVAQVATGLRGPRPDPVPVEPAQGTGPKSAFTSMDLMRQAFRDVAQANRNAAERAVKRAQADSATVVFISRFNSLRIQVTAPADRIDPGTGRIFRARPVAAQFREGIFTIDLRQPGASEVYTFLTGRDAETGKKTGDAHPHYGVDFWLASEAYEQAKEAHYQQLLQTAMSEPDIVTRLVADLQARNFDLPPAVVEQIADNTADELVRAAVRENIEARPAAAKAAKGKKAKVKPSAEEGEEGEEGE